ncbi:MAG: hypothetical protein MUE81_16525, partial [Thermoflexibacter sp.]|nr:hypothetical protein [Thermoflexibacter sp.]
MVLVNQLNIEGFELLEGLYAEQEIDIILQTIELTKKTNPYIQKDVFAIRSFLKTMPTIKDFVFTPNLSDLVKSINPNYQLVKSIFFDKPLKANWVVNWHQDLTIGILEKYDKEGFVNWTK